MKILKNFKNQIINSLKKRKENGIIILCVAILYITNNLYFKNNTTGIFGYIMDCYFNDIIGSMFFLAYSNILFLINGKAINKLGIIVLYCFGTGLVWEYLAPVLKPTSVTDKWDIVSYLIGGILYYGIIFLCDNVLFRQKKKQNHYIS